MEKDMKGELAVAISNNRKKLRFKAGTELPTKVNTVVIDLEEVAEKDGTKFIMHIEFSNESKDEVKADSKAGSK